MPHSNGRSAFRPSRVFAGLVAFAACVLVSALTHVLIGEGRDVRLASWLLALTLLATTTWLVGWRQYGVSESLVTLLVLEVLVVFAIGWFAYGGAPRLDNFFFAWFVPANVFVALPWLLGTGLGTWLRRRTPT